MHRAKSQREWETLQRHTSLDIAQRGFFFSAGSGGIGWWSGGFS